MVRKFVLITSYFLLSLCLGGCSGGGGGEGSGGVTPAPQYSISGTVTSGESGLAGVNMALTGTRSNSTTTDGNGILQFSDLSNGSYMITPSKAGYAFTPPNREVKVSNADVSGQDFVATLVTWTKAYGGVNRDIAHSIRQTADGGIIVAGEASSFGVVNSDVWILKLDINGSIQWQRSYGGIGYDIARSIQEASDGGYIVAGETSSFGTDTDVWVLKLDANGIIQWQNRYGGSGDDIAYSVRQTSDGGYIVAGETTSFGAGGADAFMLKIDANGGVVWLKSYGGTGDDRARSIQQTSDGFIVAGETDSFGAGKADIWVLKLGASGDLVWQKTFGAKKDDAAYSVQQTSDGGYIIAGEATSTGSILKKAFLLKLDASGGLVWHKTYGGANGEVAYSVQQTSDGGYIIAGQSKSFGNILGDMWVLKIRSDGGIDWQKTYGSGGSNSANFICQTTDGGYIVAGETSSFGAGNADAWVSKLDGNGNIGGRCSVIGTSNAKAITADLTEGIPSVTAMAPNAVANSTSVSPIDSTATTTPQCSFP